MPEVLQSINAFVSNPCLFMVNVLVISKCFHSIDCSDTSTLLIENHETPIHLFHLNQYIICQSRSHCSVTDLVLLQYDGTLLISDILLHHVLLPNYSNLFPC